MAVCPLIPEDLMTDVGQETSSAGQRADCGSVIPLELKGYGFADRLMKV
jgi:hypothetical protein